MTTKFYLCTTCGNVVVKFVDSGVTPFCCGKEMVEMVPGITDGTKEKHVPVVEHLDDCTIRVRVGEEVHPMIPEHYIRFICLEMEDSIQVKYLKPGQKPEATFCGCKGKPVAVYEYCSVHGLWKTDASDHCESGEHCCRTRKGC